MKKTTILTFILIVMTRYMGQSQVFPYSVAQIPYKTYSLPQPTSADNSFTDDRYSVGIPLIYDFNFFGSVYSELAIGNNGNITFNPSDFSQFDPWDIPNTQLPTTDLPLNNIFGVYQDAENSNPNTPSGNLFYGYTGTAPFRKFVVSYESIPLFDCYNLTMTSQIVLYESYNFIDVQVDERTPCTNWNNGNGVIGIQNADASLGYAPPGRDAGDWSADNEAWRFRPVTTFPDFQYILCDANLDGVESFDMNIIQNYFTTAGQTVSIYLTEADANNMVNPITGNFNNTSNSQTLFVLIDNGTTRELKRVLLAAIDCNADYDDDGVPTNNEDLNGNGNFGDDDSDGDGIPDFVDDDDDGDMVLTSNELVITLPSGPSINNFADTDGDGTPNYLDIDDDGDGLLTIYEDVALPHTYPQDGNPMNDDIDFDGIPDYLDVDDDNDGILTMNEHPDDNGNHEPEDALDTDGDGIPDYLESFDPADHDNDGIPDNVDIDDDNDGIPDIDESNGIDPLTDADGDGIPVFLDDDDNDSTIGNDNNNVEPAFDKDGDRVPNHFDLDSDGDGLYDLAESGATGFTDANMDGMVDGAVGTNGLADVLETSPDSGAINYNLQDYESDGIYDFLDADDDNDHILTINEHPDDNGNYYPDDALDTDGDGQPNYLDIDDDGDGINTIFEDIELPNNYPQDGDPTNDDTDGDGIPNYLDVDDDGDGILTINEHPDDNGNHEPEDALDTDNDGIPDYLDDQVNSISQLPDTAISMYPNPSKGILNISANINLNYMTVSIYAADGKLIKTLQLNNLTSTQITMPKVKGLYLVRIQTDKGLMQKVIIRK